MNSFASFVSQCVVGAAAAVVESFKNADLSFTASSPMTAKQCWSKESYWSRASQVNHVESDCVRYYPVPFQHSVNGAFGAFVPSTAVPQ